MKYRTRLMLIVLIAVIFIGESKLSAAQSLQIDDIYFRRAYLSEIMFRALIIAYKDFHEFLNDESTQSNKLDQKPSNTIRMLMNIDKYAVTIIEYEDAIIVTFDPRRIRSEIPIFGGIVEYRVDKSSFEFHRRLIK